MTTFESPPPPLSNLINMAESYPKFLENTVGKEEIAHYEQFLLFPLCFQKTCKVVM